MSPHLVQVTYMLHVHLKLNLITYRLSRQDDPSASEGHDELQGCVPCDVHDSAVIRVFYVKCRPNTMQHRTLRVTVVST